MKKSLSIVLAMLLSISVFAQAKDTTKIKLSDTYITSVKGDTVKVTIKGKSVSVISNDFTKLDGIDLNEVVSTIYKGKKATMELNGVKVIVEPKSEVSFPLGDKLALSSTEELNDLNDINLNDVINEKLALNEKESTDVEELTTLQKTMAELAVSQANMAVERSKVELRRAEVERQRAELEAKNNEMSESEEAEIEQLEDEVDLLEDRIEAKMDQLEEEMELIEEILERKIDEKEAQRDKRVVVSVDGVEVTDSTIKTGNTTVQEIGDAAEIVWETAKEYKEKKKKKKRTVGQFDIQLALNNFVDQDGIADGTSYDLNFWGSRYIGLKYSRKTRLFGQNSKLYFKYGLELGWNNYRLANDSIAFKGANGTSFIDGESLNYSNVSKSKLETTYLSIPIMLQLDFSDKVRSENGFNIGVGGYVGIRTNTHTNFEYKDLNNDDSKLIIKNNHFVNDLRYGLEVQVGGLWGINLFAKYDLSTLFRENRGPEINVIAFGITI